MTSTWSDRPRVYVEFPDFGYGPASTLLALVRGVADEFAWHLVATGGAAAFVRRQLPVAAWHDVDTFDSAAWPTFLDIAPPGSLVISCTNPEFAAWAVRSGYRVGVIDTLDWMWPALPEDLAGAEFHLVQEYFGAPARHVLGREVVGPIVDPALWPANGTHPDSGMALVGFGGMHLPGQDDLVARYVRWFLAAALPVLVDHAGATSVAVVGGREDLPALVPEPWRGHPGIRVRVGLDRASYAQLVRAARHLVVSPGLSALYECAASGLRPLLQPGFSMSMVLQLRTVATTTGYPYIAAWPWLADAARAVAGMAEPDGIRHVADRIADTIADSDPEGHTVATAVARYVDRCADTPALRLPVDQTLPDAATRLAAHLGRLA